MALELIHPGLLEVSDAGNRVINPTVGWKGEGGEWRVGKRRAPKLLLNQGPSEPCYATGRHVFYLY